MNSANVGKAWTYLMASNGNVDNSGAVYVYKRTHTSWHIEAYIIASDSIRLGQNLDGGSLIEAAVDDLVLYESIEGSTYVDDMLATKRRLIKVTDLLGREVETNDVIESTT